MKSVRIPKPQPYRLSEEAREKLLKKIQSTKTETVPIDTVTPNPKNAKKHPEHQVQMIAENMGIFGITQPIVIDEHGMILIGHARWAAARLLGLGVILIIRLVGLKNQEKQLLALADNRLAELGAWDDEQLKSVIQELVEAAPILDLNLDITGFDTPFIDKLLAPDGETTDPHPDDQLPDVDLGGSAVTRTGDMWICGPHRVICEDARSPSPYRALLSGALASIVFTDAPYNVPIAGFVTKRANAREFAMAVGEMTREQFIAFLAEIFGHVRAVLAPGSIVYACMDWRHYDQLLAAAENAFSAQKNLIVWVKPNAGQGSFYRSKHELIGVFVAGDGTVTNNFGLGARGRYRTNVWEYPTVRALPKSLLSLHPTIKPASLVSDALRDCSKRGDIVLDPFGGSGTTMIAAERTGRIARLIEIDPLYCDLIVRRWQLHSGKPAQLAGTEQTFDDVAAERQATGDGAAS